MSITYKFSVGDTVRIIETKHPSDMKRFPRYIAGKIGVIHDVWGRLSNPMDHVDNRRPLYCVMFYLRQMSPVCSNREKVFVDVFEDWILLD